METKGDGLAGKLALWGSVGLAFLALFGFIYSVGQSVSDVNQRLDRNCRIIILGLNDLEADINLLTLEHSAPEIARRLRRLNYGTGIADTC